MVKEGKQLLFSVTAKDCEFQTFTVSGAGGQRRDKKETGCRYIHHPSGAVGEGRESRQQIINKRTAWANMANSPEFKKWHKLEVDRLTGKVEIEKKSKGQKGFGGSQIRTYVLSGKKRIHDHRTLHTRYDVETVMNGDIGSFINIFLK